MLWYYVCSSLINTAWWCAVSRVFAIGYELIALSVQNIYTLSLPPLGAVLISSSSLMAAFSPVVDRPTAEGWLTMDHLNVFYELGDTRPISSRRLLTLGPLFRARREVLLNLANYVWMWSTCYGFICFEWLHYFQMLIKRYLGFDNGNLS